VNIVIGSDHAGFALKEHIKHFLNNTYREVTDVGTGSDESVDYPDFAVQVAEKVISGEFERGILVCGSGVGMSIVANKVPGARAVLCLDTDTARMSRMHNDTNVLALAGRRTDDETAQMIVTTWLETEFDGGRHKRRLDKIKNIENKYKNKTR
jgi:RpiB/LacA/LacB family sugar-phosphate isomerase